MSWRESLCLQHQLRFVRCFARASTPVRNSANAILTCNRCRTHVEGFGDEAFAFGATGDDRDFGAVGVEDRCGEGAGPGVGGGVVGEVSAEDALTGKGAVEVGA